MRVVVHMSADELRAAIGMGRCTLTIQIDEAKAMTDTTPTDRLREAVEILRMHNEWRRGSEVQMEQLNPGKIGAAIDAVCELVPQLNERMAKARTLLLTIWPDGEKCEHRVAREIFETLAGGA
jgi:hypothetical protein